MLQDIFGGGPANCHHRCPDLAQADAVPPPGTFQDEPDGKTGRIALAVRNSLMKQLHHCAMCLFRTETSKIPI